MVHVHVPVLWTRQTLVNGSSGGRSVSSGIVTSEMKVASRTHVLPGGCVGVGTVGKRGGVVGVEAPGTRVACLAGTWRCARASSSDSKDQTVTIMLFAVAHGSRIGMMKPAAKRPFSSECARETEVGGPAPGEVVLRPTSRLSPGRQPPPVTEIRSPGLPVFGES